MDEERRIPSNRDDRSFSQNREMEVRNFFFFLSYSTSFYFGFLHVKSPFRNIREETFSHSMTKRDICIQLVMRRNNFFV